MALFMNTNVAALNAQRALGKSGDELQRSFQRLESGTQTNTAKDAADLRISKRPQAQIDSVNAAVRKTNDGISLAQTVEGALYETSNILQQMRTLSVQAADDNNTAHARESIQVEVDHLIDEIDRIAGTTTFNNQKVLDGGFTAAHFHVGTDEKQTIRVSIKDARADALGQQAQYHSASDIKVEGGDQGLKDQDVVINDVEIRATVPADDTVSTSEATASAIAKAAAINEATDLTGVRASARPTVFTGDDDIGAVALDSENRFAINGAVLSDFEVEEHDASQSLVNQINAMSAETGVVARLDDNSRLVLKAEDGRNIEMAVTGSATRLGLLAAAGTRVLGGQIDLKSDEQFFMSGDALHKLGDVGETGATVFGINAEGAVSRLDVTDGEGATAAVETIDVAIGQVTSIRADLGAIQSRMESTVRHLQSGSENLAAAKSRILGPKFADEAAARAKEQIIQQAGVSILSQSNQSPMIALSLIGG